MIVFRTTLVAITLMLAGLVAPAATASSSHSLSTGNAITVAKKHACTKTSSGKCIKGGQFCPKAKKGKSGWDANGRRYVCKGAGSHPHWRVP